MSALDDYFNRHPIGWGLGTFHYDITFHHPKFLGVLTSQEEAPMKTVKIDGVTLTEDQVRKAMKELEKPEPLTAAQQHGMINGEGTLLLDAALVRAAIRAMDDWNSWCDHANTSGLIGVRPNGTVWHAKVQQGKSYPTRRAGNYTVDTTGWSR